jgi:hypothetical protein
MSFAVLIVRQIHWIPNMSYNSPFTGTVIQPTDVSYRAITLTENTQLQWPINGNATDDYAARIMEVSASSAGLELWMPPANQTSVGNDALIRNVGSYAFTVKDYDGTNTIYSISAGNVEYIYITDNPDEQGTWGKIAFGTGTSSADAATLAGYGLLASGTTLNQSSPVTTFSNSFTATASDRASLYVWTAGAGTLTLPLASSVGNNWFIQARNAGTGLLTVACSGSDTFNSSASVGLQPGDSCLIACSGGDFYSVGLGKSTQFNFSQLVKTVSSGTYTLTSSEASNVIQKYVSVGDLTGNVTIIVPPTIQVYYIQNATTGGASAFTVTISTGLGSVAAINPGQQATLICDSQNLVNANTILAGSTSISLINGSVGSPAMNFALETSTGIYRAGTGEFDISVLGVKQFSLTSSGATIPNGIAGGTF